MPTSEDLKTTERLDDLFVKDCDPYAAGAAFVFEKPLVEVTKAERQRFKWAFIRAFHVRAPALVASMFDYSDRLISELQKRGIFDDVDRTISATMLAEESVDRDVTCRITGAQHGTYCIRLRDHDGVCRMHGEWEDSDRTKICGKTAP